MWQAYDGLGSAVKLSVRASPEVQKAYDELLEQRALLQRKAFLGTRGICSPLRKQPLYP